MAHQRIASVVALAADQHDMVTTSQLARLGMDRHVVKRLVGAGILERLGGPGILRLAGGEPSWRQNLLAAVWSAGPGAVASHRSAARLWGLDGVTVGSLEISVPRGTGRRPGGVLVHHSTDLGPSQVVTADGIPTTEATRTLVDLAGVITADQLETAFDSALRLGLTSVPRARSKLDRLSRQGRHGVAAFRNLLDARAEVDGVTDSEFELRLIQVLRRHGLPEPTRQVELLDADGLIGRFDVAYPIAQVAIEADSERWHMDRERFHADRTRRNRAEALGWRVPSFTWRHVTREPRFVAATVERVLCVAGWDWRAARSRLCAEYGR